MSINTEYMDMDRFSWRTYDVMNTLFEPRYATQPDGGLPSYYKEGFLAIQNSIATAFIEMHQSGSEKPTTPEILLNRFPYPGYLKNILMSNINTLMQIFLLISLNYTFMNTVRFISIEKEKQLKEAMKIMGLASWMHYLSWFIRTIFMLSISMILITILIKVNIFENIEFSSHFLVTFLLRNI